MQEKQNLTAAEPAYAFRNRLLQVHQKNRRRLKPLSKDQIEITDRWQITVPAGQDFLMRCGQDLQDYFQTSMGLSLSVSTHADTAYTISFATDPSLSQEGSFRIEVSETAVCLTGKDARAAAQAGYFLEDLLNLEEAPFLSRGIIERTPRFRVRMVHSGYDEDVFPNEYLNIMIHHGFNTLLLHVNETHVNGEINEEVNDLIRRADGYGVNVYAYSHMISRLHPSDPNADSFYDSLYGELFRRYPDLKGIVFVGERVEFPSRDERTTQRLRSENFDADGKKIIKDKPNPGWFPCRDYPQWLDLVKSKIRKENPNADIVFWTYNWGYQPQDLRLELIRNLPTDISLQATFEMFENGLERDGVPARPVDYTLFFPGPGKYFLSEAKAAAERQIPLYSMTNTGGLTWDVGTVGYEPAPYQWIKRYREILRANEQYGLCGLMESHHFGFYPSFISELAKWSFFSPSEDPESILDRIIVRDWGDEHLKTVQEAYRLFSDAMHDMVSVCEDQYGAMRIGPSYPLVLFRDPHLQFPFGEGRHRGNEILCPNYAYPIHGAGNLEKLIGEMGVYRKNADRMLRGAETLKALLSQMDESKRENARRIAGVAEYMGRTALTTHHVKAWYLRKNALLEDPNADYPKLLSELLAIGRAEIENATAALPLVDFDSRLGYEPSMGYMGHRKAIEWKIGLTERVLREDIEILRRDGYVKDPSPRDYPHSVWD